MSKKRNIFEEVGGERKAVGSAAVGVIDRASKGARDLIRVWLMVVFFLLAANVLLGVLNRKGAMGPDQILWLAFAVWAVGFVGILASDRVPTGWMGRMIFTGVLTALLALTQWWSVVFYGVAHLGEVDAYKILFQRGLAYGAMGLIVWYILQLSRSEADLLVARRARSRRLWILSAMLVVLAMIQVLYGAVLAGIDGADAFTDWPLVDGKFIPDQMFGQAPLWQNAFENPVFGQFVHRFSGFVLLLFGADIWLHSRKNGSVAVRRAYSLVLLMLLVQFGLGAAATITGGMWHGALSFQLGAIILWVLILRARFLTGYPTSQSVRD